MQCSNCGAQNPEGAAFCGQCGRSLVAAPAPVTAATLGGPPASEQLAGWGQRVGSFLIDWALEGLTSLVPFVGWLFGLIATVVNLVMYRRGNTIGLKVLGARIVRENGDVSGFFHTSVRGWASVISALPLGLGFWWAFWDPYRQTWHDKMLGTYVLKDTLELAARRGTSSRAAVVIFWVALGVTLALLVAFIVVILIILAVAFVISSAVAFVGS